ncbi:MAG: hypothetical protein KDC48_13350 [Planctomycetes bacterium]|nr:hypothetical protein [Planctomycetota bacterium]
MPSSAPSDHPQYPVSTGPHCTNNADTWQGLQRSDATRRRSAVSRR